MGRIFWVDNVIGSDSYAGLSSTYPFLSVDKAIDTVVAYGKSGDIIRVCYTGSDYTYNASQSALSAVYNITGSGWGTDEFFTLEGYDKTGGRNRPRFLLPVGASTGYGFTLSLGANYWLFKDLWFYYENVNTTYSTAGVYFSASLYDSDSYFRFRGCRFEGQYGTNTSCHDAGIYVGGGSRALVDIQNCLFYNISLPLKNWTATPVGRGWIIKNNIFYFPGYAGSNYFYWSSLPEVQDFTFSNNTFIALGPSPYYGYTALISNGDLSTSNVNTNFEFKNNFVFWCNYGLRSGGTLVVENDVTNYVGYNTFGRNNSSTAFYSLGFDICETEGSGKAVGDYNIGAYTTADYTTLFVGYADWTYYWPESGWMTIPDLRPQSWEMTGTWEDPINGIRGAIERSGVYVGSQLDTQHQVVVDPSYYKANNRSYTGSITAGDFPYMVDADPTTTLRLRFNSTNESVAATEFCYYGGNSNCYNSVASYSLVSTTWRITSTTLANNCDRRGDMDFPIYTKTRARIIGATTTTGSWSSSFTRGSRLNTVANAIAAGSYELQLQYWTAHDDLTSAWETIHSFSI